MYARLDDGFFDHPKVLETSLAALGLYGLALSYAARHLTNGKLSHAVVQHLGRGAPGLAAAAELVTIQLWDRDPKGYRIHDYLKINASRADMEAMRAGTRERVRAFRARSNAVSNAVTHAFVPGLGPASPARSRAPRQKLEDQKQEKASATNAETAHATKSKSDAAVQLIAEINRVGGRNFSVTAKANLTFARARLADYPLPELLAMIRWRWRMWDEGMRGQFFRPETLLNATKCESYLGSMPATERAGVPRPVVRNPELDRIAARDRELGRG